MGTMPGKRFVHGVINHLKDQMVETADRGISNIHPRPFANRLQTGQNLDMVSPVFLFEHALPRLIARAEKRLFFWLFSRRKAIIFWLGSKLKGCTKERF